MTQYRRSRTPGGSFFFTVNLLDRRSNRLVTEIDALRNAIRQVRAAHPFSIDAMVVLPEHLHAIWTLPPDDANYALRWRLIKTRFSRATPAIERRSHSRLAKGERGIWQRRYWEHLIRNEEDMQRHVDYIHFNPVKHGYVDQAFDWPYSTIHRYVASGDVRANWACGDLSLDAGESG